MKWQKYYSILALFLHEQRSLVGYSPRGCKESQMTDTQAQPGTYDNEWIDSWINNIDKMHNHVKCHRMFKVLHNCTHLTRKAMAPHSSTLAWKIPWTEEPGRLQSTGSLRVGHDWATSLSLFTFMHWRRKWRPTPVFLPGESQGSGSLVGCRLWAHTESDMTEVTQQQQQHTRVE